MEKSRKKILVLVLSIVMLFSLAAMGTYALFVDSSSITGNKVTAGSVGIDASVEITKTSSMGVDQTVGAFANGGTAVIEGGRLVATNMTPGDKVTLALNIANTSNVNIKYRVIISTVTPSSLFEMSYEGAALAGDKTMSDWSDVVNSGAAIAAKTLEIGMAKNAVADADGEIVFDITVYAVQANGETSVHFLGAAGELGAVEKNHTYVLAQDFAGDLVFDQYATLDLNGRTLTGNVTFQIADTERGYVNIVGETGVINGRVTIDAPNGTVSHFGTVDSVDVVAVADHSYHIYGTCIKTVTVQKGRVVVEKTAFVYEINIPAVENVENVVVESAGRLSNITVPAGSEEKLTVEGSTPNVVVKDEFDKDTTEAILVDGEMTVEAFKEMFAARFAGDEDVKLIGVNGARITMGDAKNASKDSIEVKGKKIAFHNMDFVGYMANGYAPIYVNTSVAGSVLELNGCSVTSKIAGTKEGFGSTCHALQIANAAGNSAKQAFASEIHIVGSKLTGTGNYVRGIAYAGGIAGDVLELKSSKVTVDLGGANATSVYGRGSSFFDQKELRISIDNSTIENFHYALNFTDQDFAGSVVDIKNGSFLEGYAALNIWAQNLTVNVKDSTLSSKNVNRVGTNDFSTVVINETAENVAVNIADSTVTAKKFSTAEQSLFSMRTGVSLGNVINVTGASTLKLTYEGQAWADASSVSINVADTVELVGANGLPFELERKIYVETAEELSAAFAMEGDLFIVLMKPVTLSGTFDGTAAGGQKTIYFYTTNAYPKGSYIAATGKEFMMKNTICLGEVGYVVTNMLYNQVDKDGFFTFEGNTVSGAFACVMPTALNYGTAVIKNNVFENTYDATYEGDLVNETCLTQAPVEDSRFTRAEVTGNTFKNYSYGVTVNTTAQNYQQLVIRENKFFGCSVLTRDINAVADVSYNYFDKLTLMLCDGVVAPLYANESMSELLPLGKAEVYASVETDKGTVNVIPAISSNRTIVVPQGATVIKSAVFFATDSRISVSIAPAIADNTSLTDGNIDIVATLTAEGMETAVYNIKIRVDNDFLYVPKIYAGTAKDAVTTELTMKTISYVDTLVGLPEIIAAAIDTVWFRLDVDADDAVQEISIGVVGMSDIRFAPDADGYFAIPARYLKSYSNPDQYERVSVAVIASDAEGNEKFSFNDYKNIKNPDGEHLAAEYEMPAAGRYVGADGLAFVVADGKLTIEGAVNSDSLPYGAQEVSFYKADYVSGVLKNVSFSVSTYVGILYFVYDEAAGTITALKDAKVCIGTYDKGGNTTIAAGTVFTLAA